MTGMPRMNMNSNMPTPNMLRHRKNERHEKTQAALLRKITKAGHMLNDIKLYLDTHPNCKHALAHFEKYQNMLDLLTYDYNLKYNPLTARLSENAQKEKHWHWIEEPWPWENEANECEGI